MSKRLLIGAAASVRLCVETHFFDPIKTRVKAAASVRLCVETRSCDFYTNIFKAAASVRLCVETKIAVAVNINIICSRLRAAVC